MDCKPIRLCLKYTAKNINSTACARQSSKNPGTRGGSIYIYIHIYIYAQNLYIYIYICVYIYICRMHRQILYIHHYICIAEMPVCTFVLSTQACPACTRLSHLWRLSPETHILGIDPKIADLSSSKSRAPKLDARLSRKPACYPASSEGCPALSSQPPSRKNSCDLNRTKDTVYTLIKQEDTVTQRSMQARQREMGTISNV